MKITFKRAVISIAVLAFIAAVTQFALAATFITNSAYLSKGQSITTSLSKNGNRTRFYFVAKTTNPNTKSETAYVQWAPLVPKAKGYRNGLMLDRGKSVRMQLNGIWFTLTFDGKNITIQ